MLLEEEDVKIINNTLKNNEICLFLKKTVEYDIRNMEKLINNLRLKNLLLNDTIGNQLLEINKLNNIILMEPEINQKGRNLLLESLKSLNFEVLKKTNFIKDLEEKVKSLTSAGKIKSDKLLLLQKDLLILKSELNILNLKNVSLEEELKILINNNLNKLLEKSYLHQHEIEVYLKLLNLSRSDVIEKYYITVNEFDKCKITNSDLLITNFFLFD